MSYASNQILRTKLIEEKRTIDTIAGRLLKHKISFAGGDLMLEQQITDAANKLASGSALLDNIVEQLDMRLR